MSVSIGGSACDVKAPVTDTQLTCETNSATSGNYLVVVNFNGMGRATQVSYTLTYLQTHRHAGDLRGEYKLFSYETKTAFALP